MARKNIAMDLAKNMTYSKFKKLTPQEQKRVTSILVSAMNKRIKRLGATEIGRLSPTYQAYERRLNEGKGKNGYYTIRGVKNSDELYNRFENLSESLKKATSLREWKTLRNKTLTALNLENIKPEEEKAFWHMYNKFQESSRKFKQYRKEISDKILYYIARKFESKGYDYTSATQKNIMRWVTKEYEKSQQQKANKNRERSTSVYVYEGDESE